MRLTARKIDEHVPSRTRAASLWHKVLDLFAQLPLQSAEVSLASLDRAAQGRHGRLMPSPREFSAVATLRGPGMSDEVQYYDEELTELIQTIEDGVDQLARKRQPAAKAEVGDPHCTATAGHHTAPQPRASAARRRSPTSRSA